MSAFKRRPSKFSAWLARLRAPDKRAQLSNAADSTEMRLLNGRPAEKGSFRDCDEARQMNTGLHLLINALSTILLGSSNYCMQCLSAPTRKEVDRAHAQRRSLDIGVLSVSNLLRINRKRAVMWAILGLTSIPLHLFYNSIIYLSIAVPNYRAIAVGESFVSGDPITNFTMSKPFLGKTSLDWDAETKTIYDSVRNGSYERLENLECINAYAQLLQTRRRNLVLVAADDSYPESTGILDQYGADSHIYWDLDFDGVNTIQIEETSKAFRWMCSSVNSTHTNCPVAIEQFRAAPETWTVGAFCADALCGDAGFVEKMQMTGPIQYCLSERAEEHCKVHWNLAIAALVTILNFIKAALILYTALYTKEQPLMTMGDAVASFLEVEDPTTVGMCLASKKDMWPASPRQWSGARFRWKDVTSKTRRVCTFLLLLTCLAAVAGLLYYGLRWLSYNSQSFTLPALARIGFGATDPRTIFQSTLYSVIGNALVANTPQVILSFIYLLLNSLFTTMLLSHEWASYTRTRKGLRTSGARRGNQRSTYFLSLPYRFAVPLMVVSALLHWLVSQSIFLVAIEVRPPPPLTFSFPPDSHYIHSTTR
ncbi:hypothetical protein E8E13_008650 [Curvularia kusanoi]|uniref:DUF6536 domain-containing protein n=1 Tax=Curvularia kusanoi TaxID=90978 RepID=A0A9P4TIR4_CURKU|nr:hypothetical protein E8E13_008650 [Curvularia kusanoi]